MVKQVGADQRDAWWERWGKWRVQTATRQACWTLARARYRSLPQQTKTTSSHPIPHSPHQRSDLPPGSTGARGKFPSDSPGRETC